MVDILYCGPRGWEVYEVKSSTSEKQIFLQDLALQAYVIEGSGLKVKSYSLIHLNPHYERQEKLQLSKLFTIHNLTEKVQNLQPEIQENIEKFRHILSASTSPELAIGPHCFHPYECDFIPHCWKDVPSPSVFNLSGLQMDQKFNLYHQGIHHLRDIPDHVTLNERQKRQLQSERENTQYLNQEGVSRFLSTLHYPLYFLDFEAFQLPIPLYPKTKPYQQIAFQYSIHYQTTPNSPLLHHDFLAMPGQDPRHDLAQSLVDNIPPNACILAYNSSYEKSVLRQLAELFPQFASALTLLEHQILDLMPPFQAQHVYNKAMNGSSSIKAILPALIPDLSYTDLHIQDGQSAARAYTKLSQLTTEEERQELRNHLLEYCKMDTLAMAKLVEFLRNIRLTTL